MHIEQVFREDDTPYVWRMFHLYLRWELQEILAFAERKETDWQINTTEFINQFCSNHPRDLVYSNDEFVKNLLLSLTRAYVCYNLETELSWTTQVVKQIPKIEGPLPCDVTAVMALLLFYFVMHGKAEEYEPLRDWLKDETLWRIRITETTDPYVLFCCAVTLSYSGDHKAAFQMSERLLEFGTEGYVDLGQFLAARNCEEIGLHEESLHRYKTVVELNDQLVLALNNLGNSYSRQNQVEKTFEAYQLAIENNDKYSTVFYNLANLYYKCEYFTEAIENYTKAIRLRRVFPDALNNRANCYCFHGMFESALADYNAVIEHNQSSHAYYSRALLYSDMGEGRNAGKDFVYCLQQELRHEFVECSIDVIKCLLNQLNLIDSLTIPDIPPSELYNISTDESITDIMINYDVDQTQASNLLEMRKSRRVFWELEKEFKEQGGLNLILEIMNKFSNYKLLIDIGNRLLQKHMNTQDIKIAKTFLQNRIFRNQIENMFTEEMFEKKEILKY